MLNINKDSHKLLTVDKNFTKRAFYTTLFVSILMILVSLRYQSFAITLSLVIGIIISFCSSLVLWRWINYIFRDLNPDIIANSKSQASKSNATIKSFAFAFMGIGKIFVLGLVFFLIFKFLTINIYALFIGISAVQLVVLSMIVSIVLVNMLNRVGGVNSKSSHTSGYDTDVNVKPKSVSKNHSHQTT
jgi:multisubunit Na+/H+ antiporter MnhG subunit